MLQNFLKNLNLSVDETTRIDCPICFNKSEWKKSNNIGKIIEFSKKDSTYFGLVEIDHGIRIMGEISSTSIPKTGQSVTMNVSFDSKPNYSFIVENN